MALTVLSGGQVAIADSLAGSIWIQPLLRMRRLNSNSNSYYSSWVGDTHEETNVLPISLEIGMSDKLGPSY